MKYIVWVVSIFLLGARAVGEGGDTAGNGGDILVCTEVSGTTYRLLDYFEAEFGKSGLKPDLVKGGDPEDKAKSAVDRLSVLDTPRHDRLFAAASAFLGNVEWIEDGPPLEAIPDLGEVKIPSNCRVAQIAIRRKTFHPTIKPFLVDKRLWNLLSLEHRAGLILHEIIYGEMIALGHTTSVMARSFNGYLSSSLFDHTTQPEYDKMAEHFFAKVKPLAFKSQAFSVRATPGGTIQLKLRDLLSDASLPVARWYVVQGLPAWLHLDATTEMLTGQVPADVTPFSLSLVAHDGKAGAICELQFGSERSLNNRLNFRHL